MDYDDKYEDMHTHYNEELDNKGRKHSIFIYQDYRSIDGFLADDGFDANEVMGREDYDYYIDKDSKELLKKEIDNNRCYVLSIEKNNDEYYKTWNRVNDYNSRCLFSINDFKIVLEYINHAYYDKELAKYREEESLIKYVDGLFNNKKLIKRTIK